MLNEKVTERDLFCYRENMNSHDLQSRNERYHIIEGALYISTGVLIPVQTMMPALIKRLGGGDVLIGAWPVVVYLAYFMPQVISANYSGASQYRKSTVIKYGFIQRLHILLLACAIAVWGASAPTLALTLLFLLEAISKTLSKKDDDASEMDKAKKVFSVIFITNNKTTEIMQPSKQTFDTPSFNITTQRSAVLGFWFDSILFMRRDYFNTILLKFAIERIRVIRSITDESLGSSLKEATLESLSNKGDFMWRSRCNVYGERKTRAVCHCHELRPLAPLGFSDTGAPFFATTKVASIKHSSRLNLPRSSKSLASASRISRNLPERTHSWSRRWHVWYGGNFSGISFHRAPVRKTQRIPLTISRLARLGRPLPSARTFCFGMKDSICVH